MTSLLLRAPWLAAALAAGALTLAPRLATAQDCASDSDCEEGYVCQTDEYESCTVSGCPRGEMCPDAEPVCETVEYTTCAPSPCATDADCPDRMACHSQSYYVCSGGMAGSGAPCAPDGACDEPMPPADEPTCWEEVGENLCTPRHQLPCTAAADCGAGFDCIESRYWICTGGGMAGAGGAAAAGSGALPPPPVEPSEPAPGTPTDREFECHEESSGEFYCQLQDLPCSANADCPAGLECKDNYLYPPCVGYAGMGGTAGDGSSGSDDAPEDPGAYECPEPVIEQRCMPPEYYGGGMGPVPGTGGSPGGIGSNPGGGGEAGAGDPGDTMGGSAGTSAMPPTSSSGPGSSAGAGGQADESGESDGDDDGPRGLGWLLSGCSASGPISADPLGWITFGLLAIALRRRARRVV